MNDLDSDAMKVTILDDLCSGRKTVNKCSSDTGIPPEVLNRWLKESLQLKGALPVSPVLPNQEPGMLHILFCVMSLLSLPLASVVDIVESDPSFCVPVSEHSHG